MKYPCGVHSLSPLRKSSHTRGRFSKTETVGFEHYMFSTGFRSLTTFATKVVRDNGEPLRIPPEQEKQFSCSSAQENHTQSCGFSEGRRRWDSNPRGLLYPTSLAVRRTRPAMRRLQLNGYYQKNIFFNTPATYLRAWDYETRQYGNISSFHFEHRSSPLFYF